MHVATTQPSFTKVRGDRRQPVYLEVNTDLHIIHLYNRALKKSLLKVLPLQLYTSSTRISASPPFLAIPLYKNHNV